MVVKTLALQMFSCRLAGQAALGRTCSSHETSYVIPSRRFLKQLVWHFGFASRASGPQQALLLAAEAATDKSFSPGLLFCTTVVQWLEIKPTDDEKTAARKKKLLKSYKSKKRFQQMDVKQKERQTSWQNFQKGKGSKAKSGRCQPAVAVAHGSSQ